MYNLISSAPKCTRREGDDDESLSLPKLLALIRNTACDDGVFRTLFRGMVILGIAFILGGACRCFKSDAFFLNLLFF